MNISYQNIDEILQNLDIEGLIASGAPSDEYLSEARQIASAISLLDEHQRTNDNILSIVSLVWIESFGIDEEGMKKRLPELIQFSNRISD